MAPPLVVAPTPVERAQHASDATGCEIWIKRDDRTHGAYGGNKPRKLVHLLAAAQARGATDVVTLGAVGSHHVLATTVHGRALGLSVHAILTPQPRTDHAMTTVRASLAQGAHLVAADATWRVPLLLAREVLRLRARGRRVYVMSIGGSSPTGSRGYMDAVDELAGQIDDGAMDGRWPDAMVVPLGSGGTYAGLLGGVAARGVATRVVGVRVTDRWMVQPALIAWMARRAADGRADGLRARDVRVIDEQAGDGYGHATEAGREATALFARDGIALDPTYTAKAAAGLLALARGGGHGRRYLFWHTLSSAPLGPLTVGGPVTLPADLDALFVDATRRP